MKNNKFDEAGKSKDDQQIAVLSSSVKQIRQVADTNQNKLKQLELAIANLTTICSAIRHDMYSLTSSSPSKSKQGSFRKTRAEVVDGSRLCSSKNDVLGVQMQQIVKQAAALGIHKDYNTNSIKFSGKTKAESKPPTKAVRKIVQASKNQKSSTKPLIQSKQSTTEKKSMSMKLQTVKKNDNIEATQPKAKRAPQSIGKGNNNMKANNTTNTENVSLKSTVKRTKTTISSKVYVNQSAANKSKKATTVKNVETAKGKGQKFSPKNHALTNRFLSSGAVVSEIRHPRKKWSTAKEITPTNFK